MHTCERRGGRRGMPARTVEAAWSEREGLGQARLSAPPHSPPRPPRSCCRSEVPPPCLLCSKAKLQWDWNSIGMRVEWNRCCRADEAWTELNWYRLKISFNSVIGCCFRLKFKRTTKATALLELVFSESFVPGSIHKYWACMFWSGLCSRRFRSVGPKTMKNNQFAFSNFYLLLVFLFFIIIMICYNIYQEREKHINVDRDSWAHNLVYVCPVF